MKTKNKHRAKIRLARRLATKVINGKPRIITLKGYGIFGTVAWDMRKLIIAQRVHNREVQAHYRKLAREEAKKKAQAAINITVA